MNGSKLEDVLCVGVSFLFRTERKPCCCCGECLIGGGGGFSINMSFTEKLDFGFLGSLERGVFDLGDEDCRSSFVVMFNLCSCV